MRKKFIAVTVLVLSIFSHLLAFSFPKQKKSYILPLSSQKETHLMMAAYKGDVYTMRQLITQGADVNEIAWCEQPRAGKPVLRYAIDSGSIKAVELLIQNGADVNTFTTHGFIVLERQQQNVRNLPLLSSAINSYASINIIKALINGKADINQKAMQ